MTLQSVPNPDWWVRRRLRYNLYFVGSVVVGFIAYQIILHAFKATIGRPYLNSDGTASGTYDIDIDDGPFGGCAQVCGIGVVVLIANLFYFLGPALERFIPVKLIPRYRPVAWWAGTLLSCTPPLAIPMLHLTFCLFFPSVYNQTPIAWPDDTPSRQPTTATISAPTTQIGHKSNRSGGGGQGT